MLDLEAFKEGRCTINNKPARTKEITETIDGVTSGRRLAFDILRRQRSRLTYCRAQCFGRFGAAALGALNAVREDQQLEVQIPEACLEALSRLRRYLVTAPPRSLQAGFEAPILFLWTARSRSRATSHH